MRLFRVLLVVSVLLVGCTPIDSSIDTPNAPKVHSCYMCGSEEVYVNAYEHGYWIECENCHMKTGNYADYKELVEKWNKIGENIDEKNN